MKKERRTNYDHFGQAAFSGASESVADYIINFFAKKGIKKAINEDFLRKVKEMKFIYSNGNVAGKMIDTIKSCNIKTEFLQKKLNFNS